MDYGTVESTRIFLHDLIFDVSCLSGQKSEIEKVQCIWIIL